MARGAETAMAKGGGDNDGKADQGSDDDDNDEMVETSIEVDSMMAARQRAGAA